MRSLKDTILESINLSKTSNELDTIDLVKKFFTKKTNYSRRKIGPIEHYTIKGYSTDKTRLPDMKNIFEMLGYDFTTMEITISKMEIDWEIMFIFYKLNDGTTETHSSFTLKFPLNTYASINDVLKQYISDIFDSSNSFRRFLHENKNNI
jgi:hypothetical protein